MDDNATSHDVKENDAIHSQLLVFSASNEAGLESNIQAFAAHAKKIQTGRNHPRYLQFLAHTLAVRRTHHPWRLALMADSLLDLATPTFPIARRRTLRNVTIGFVFTGQGAQYAQMGLELLKYEIFRVSLQACQAALNSCGCTWDIEGKHKLESSPSLTDSSLVELARTSEESNIQTPEYSQTLTTVLQVALVDFFRALGVKPTAVIGHSSGEIAAA